MQQRMMFAVDLLQALSPHYIFLYFVRKGMTGWESLGGIVLAITDMCHTPSLHTHSSCATLSCPCATCLVLMKIDFAV